MSPIGQPVQPNRWRLVDVLASGAVALEHLLALWWGVVWPWSHLALYPSDAGVNEYMILATTLLVGVNLAAAAAYRHHIVRRLWLGAFLVALPLGAGLLIALLDAAFLDPVVYYLALLPAVMAILVPFQIAAKLAPAQE